MNTKIELPPDVPVDAEGFKAGGWWHEEEGGRLACDVCPRGCRLGSDDRGFCFVRQNRGGRIVSTTYGRSTGFCIDPIEKKPLNHFYPGTSVLSFGTAGCNLGCKFCQNWTTTKSREVERTSDEAAPEAVAEAARRLDCRSVAYTYNDPIVWIEYARDTARACRAVGVKNVAVTSGYMTPAARAAFYEWMDAANVDLKAFDEDFYRRLCGGHLEPVLDTLRWLAHETDVWLEITNLVIPGENDQPEAIERMCRWVVDELGPDVPLHFSAFHPDFKMTDRGPTPLETLLTAHDVARRAGLSYVYTGNVVDAEHQSTYCPACGEVVIRRDGYRLATVAIEQGRCGHCGHRIAGRFDEKPGTWGGRRQPVRIADFAPAKTPKETKMSDQAGAAARPDLTDEQEQLLFRAAGRRVAAAVAPQPPGPTEPLPDELGNRRVVGAFVSLKRAGQLRSCCGFLGPSVALSEALDSAAFRAATDDPRFPPISPTELAHLDMEVWLLWGMQPIEARGDDRVKAVEIGRHGLQVQRGAARGLLLPAVATEHHLDAEAFLRQTCLKAQLPPDAWRDDATRVSTFEGYAIHGPLGGVLEPEQPEPAPAGPSELDTARLADFCRANLLAMTQGATPSFYLPGAFDGNVHGLAAAVNVPALGQTFHVSRLSIKPGMPLQATLSSLIQTLANMLRTRRVAPAALRDTRVGLSILWDPAMHGAADRPDLSGVEPGRRAVVIMTPSGWAWAHDPGLAPDVLLADVMAGARVADPAGVSVLSLAIRSTEPKATATNIVSPDAPRPAAVAGTFYPGSADEINRSLDAMIPGRRKPERWAGAMVPHAGWVYSGKLAAGVLSRIAIPSRVIVFSPKHGPGGADWAVAPNSSWQLPGRDVASDPELAARLAEAIDGLALDSASHRAEHAIEVQLPILARLAPDARVVGIAMHGGDWPALDRFAEQLAGVLSTLSEPPLLIISTDMNHFANDVETRRRDRLALDAIEALDPRRLLDVVQSESISMCGVTGAVVVLEALRRTGHLTRCEPIGYQTSFDTTGDPSRVVGYAGMLFD